ncbi:glycosyltransferase family 1 protein [Cytobacillus firmus]|uniref:glycosyltransferase family 1 protein n=1 Tax=Cytobacillus firmus TaxID=1399 RepID=UPI001CFCE00F|nr:glycosyltransferase family 1 protein [Cytobacillus firmus]URT70222.1 glycosyltransferase family 1 protein [Cytobacillus firmus]
MGSPLRVLHVVVNMNRGGAETLIMNLYRNIDRSKVQFDFLTCKPGAFDDEIRKMGGKIHRIPYVSEVGHFKYMRELDQFFLGHKYYKIVHSHMDKMSGIVLRSAKKAGLPIRISHSHNTQSEGGLPARTYKWMAGKLIIPNSTSFFACSNYAAKWLFNKKSGLTRILKNGIEYDKFSYSSEVRKQVRKELQLNQNNFVLGHVGRFAHQKNHSFLIDVFADFCKVNENAVLLLVGDGPLRKDIEKKVSGLHLDKKVKFLGVRSDINRILQGLDVFVFPSLHEGLPVSLIEAQGAGLPCFISDQVSPEVDLGMNLVEFVSINEKSLWRDKLERLPLSDTSRRSFKEPFKAKGYDITATALEIEAFYLTVAG